MEKFGVIKKKILLFIVVAGLGGLEQGHRGRKPPTPPGAADGQLSFSVLMCEGGFQDYFALLPSPWWGLR